MILTKFILYFIKKLSCRYELFWPNVFFSSAELKARVSFSDCPLSGVHPSVNFYILNFFSRITWSILIRLGTNHPWMEGIQVCLNKGDSPSPRGDNMRKNKYTLKFLKNLLLQNQLAKFNQTWYKLSLGQ
jgi:hypothetical protein